MQIKIIYLLDVIVGTDLQQKYIENIKLLICMSVKM